MEIKSVIDLINGVGFPIFMAIVLLWMHRENVKQTRNLVEKFYEAMNANTAAIQAITSKMKCGVTNE